VALEQVPKKGREASRALLRMLKKRAYIPMLIDQRLGDGGIPVPFFGREAMTTPAAAVLAIKYDYPVFMAHCERHGGAHFKIKVSERLQFTRTGDEMVDVYNALIVMNDYLEARIRERPWEWLWAHNRWKPGVNAMPIPEEFVAKAAAAKSADAAPA
jgi:KDO2-lipid IV(A) lauroyltransferase